MEKAGSGVSEVCGLGCDLLRAKRMGVGVMRRAGPAFEASPMIVGCPGLLLRAMEPGSNPAYGRGPRADERSPACAARRRKWTSFRLNKRAQPLDKSVQGCRILACRRSRIYPVVSAISRRNRLSPRGDI